MSRPGGTHSGPDSPEARRPDGRHADRGGIGTARVPTMDTPALVVDVDLLEANLVHMAGAAADRGITLRPHAKTHKCRAIARRQMAHGAAGLTVATLGEAEYFADDVDDLFVAYPVWPEAEQRHRLRALAERVRVRVGVDSPEAAAAMGALGRHHAPSVMVEIDSGHHRSGVRPAEAATVACAAERAGLVVSGVFTFPGHAYAPGAARRASADEVGALAEASSALARAGFDPVLRSGGSTPTAGLSPAGRVDELRPGVYAFNDGQQVRLGSCGPAAVALGVVATVVSAPAPDRVVLNAGSKALGGDGPAWMPGFGLLPDWPAARVQWLSEHHGVVAGEAGAVALPGLGEQVVVIPNHVCNAVNLFDRVLAVRDGEVVDHWEIAPRSSNR